MRRLLREMRFVAAGLAIRGMSREADKLLTMTERIPSIRDPERIRRYRAELLYMQTMLRAWPVIQDDLSSVLAQLRARETILSG